MLPTLSLTHFRKANKSVCVQLPTSTVNVTLLAFAAERRAAVPCCGAAAAGRPATAAVVRYLLALSSKPAARRACGRMLGQTSGRTPYRFIDPAAHTMGQ